MQRCDWTGNDALMMHYHDTEWGVPVHDDQLLFEYLVLDAFQAGLSWKTVLHKRENFRQALDGFDAAKIACYDDAKIAALLADKGIIRNKLKISATIGNA
ncbi:DNA-3-methyladenine glycosylase I, partial [Arthrospira platensis SPKY1]|nr:DNA-3-methyladenine glycosylase I [Arthrospira platensis SPKY1]